MRSCPLYSILFQICYCVNTHNIKFALISIFFQIWSIPGSAHTQNSKPTRALPDDVLRTMWYWRSKPKPCTCCALPLELFPSSFSMCVCVCVVPRIKSSQSFTCKVGALPLSSYPPAPPPPFYLLKKTTCGTGEMHSGHLPDTQPTWIKLRKRKL